MAFREREDLRAATSVLRDAGFTISQPCNSRPSCFDLAARREGALIFISVQGDVGAFSVSDSRELRAISESLSAGSLLIGKETREKPLEDDTVYTRHDVLTMNLKTFENVALHNIPPLIQANPGGYYVEIDAEALKRKRQELGLSVGEIAKMVGTSRRTIYGYERGMAKASVPATYKLLWALGVPVARPINIFERANSQHRYCLLKTARQMFARNKLLNRVFGRCSRCRVATVRKAPFDFVISIPDEDITVVGGIARNRDPGLTKRVDEIVSVSEVVQAHPILVTKGKEQIEKRIQCISSEEISKFKSTEDLIATIR